MQRRILLSGVRAGSRRSIAAPRIYARGNASSSSSSAPTSGQIQAGLIGAGATAALFYGYYSFSGTKRVVDTAKKAVNTVEATKQKISQNVPDAADIAKGLRSTIDPYLGLIPGAKPVVDAFFEDIDKLQGKHGDELNQIIKSAYGEIKDAADTGLTADTAKKIASILQKYSKRVQNLAKEASNDLLEQHPELKDQVGGSLDELQELADRAGPEAKKKLEEAYNQVQNIAKNGLTPSAIAASTYFIQDAIKSIRQTSDQAYSEGLKVAKPFLDKNPQIKKLVDENADAIKSGDFKQLFQSFTSGTSADEIQKQVQDYLSNTGKQSAEQFASYIKKIPGVDKIPHVEEFIQLTKERSTEAEKLLRATYEDIKDVLVKRADEASKLMEKTKQDAKK